MLMFPLSIFLYICQPAKLMCTFISFHYLPVMLMLFFILFHYQPAMLMFCFIFSPHFVSLPACYIDVYVSFYHYQPTIFAFSFILFLHFFSLPPAMLCFPISSLELSFHYQPTMLMFSIISFHYNLLFGDFLNYFSSFVFIISMLCGCYFIFVLHFFSLPICYVMFSFISIHYQTTLLAVSFKLYLYLF